MQVMNSSASRPLNCAVSAAPQARGLLKWLGYQLLVVIAIAMVVALVLVQVNDQAWVPTLVYSGCISLACSCLIQGGRLLLAHYWTNPRLPAGSPMRGHYWPGWPLMLVVLVVGTSGGYSIGNAAGNWLTGYSSPGLYDSNLGRAASLVFFSLIPGLVLTLHALSRARLSAAEIAAQTAQRLAAENQLKLLESQLEPHMLFNTLANLRVLIGKDPIRAQRMLDQLIAFLRATLQASRSGVHSLSTEFARIEDYLALMAVRMGGRLQYQLTLPSELATCVLPTLLLQPLVENAIKHGLEPNVAGGRIEISAGSEAGQLLLKVRDTGAGLDTADKDEAGTHFGLQQVRDRLHTRYGDAAGLNIETATDGRGGTLVSVRMPISNAESIA